MQNLTADQIISAIANLSSADVRRVNAASYAMAVSKGRFDAAVKKDKLKVGMKVCWTGKNGYTTGTIFKVNRVKCIVETSNNGKWTIPMTMLSEVK